jgi:hypothetical protein
MAKYKVMDGGRESTHWFLDVELVLGLRHGCEARVCCEENTTVLRWVGQLAAF